MKVLEATGITKVFPGVVALDSVDVSFEPGEIHCIIGEIPRQTADTLGVHIHRAGVVAVQHAQGQIIACGHIAHQTAGSIVGISAGRYRGFIAAIDHNAVLAMAQHTAHTVSSRVARKITGGVGGVEDYAALGRAVVDNGIPHLPHQQTHTVMIQTTVGDG